jgi:hypothetical protein
MNDLVIATEAAGGRQDNRTGTDEIDRPERVRANLPILAIVPVVAVETT